MLADKRRIERNLIIPFREHTLPSFAGWFEKAVTIEYVVYDPMALVLTVSAQRARVWGICLRKMLGPIAVRASIITLLLTKGSITLSMLIPVNMLR